MGKTCYQVNVELEKNPYSCFDGYSIVDFSEQEVTPDVAIDNAYQKLLEALLLEDKGELHACKLYFDDDEFYDVATSYGDGHMCGIVLYRFNVETGEVENIESEWDSMFGFYGGLAYIPYQGVFKWDYDRNQVDRSWFYDDFYRVEGKRATIEKRLLDDFRWDLDVHTYYIDDAIVTKKEYDDAKKYYADLGEWSVLYYGDMQPIQNKSDISKLLFD
ncbi:MAG: hypothetical protein IJ791_06050 [Lachnospiraceae bacterium]|nr:hypothetical protein [Lachnospiraceae bacterium]